MWGVLILVVVLKFLVTLNLLLPAINCLEEIELYSTRLYFKRIGRGVNGTCHRVPHLSDRDGYGRFNENDNKFHSYFHPLET